MTVGQAGPFLRRTTEGFSHWCPGCKEMHHINVDTPRADNGAQWGFNGDLLAPTFTPSVNITWAADADPEFPTTAGACHYFLTAGRLLFLGDCTHALKGQTVPLPWLPIAHRDHNRHP